MKCAFVLALVAVLPLAGCKKDVPPVNSSPATNSTSTPPAGDAGLKVNAPGAEVKVGGGEGIEVKTPATDIKVGGGEGVKVDAPATDVNVNP